MKQILNDPLLFLSNNEAEKYYNAGNAVVYKLNNTNIYKKKYNLCKVVLFHKKDRADILEYYWYNDSNKDNVDKIIEQTRGLLRFKD